MDARLILDAALTLTYIEANLSETSDDAKRLKLALKKLMLLLEIEQIRKLLGVYVGVDEIDLTKIQQIENLYQRLAEIIERAIATSGSKEKEIWEKSNPLFGNMLADHIRITNSFKKLIDNMSKVGILIFLSSRLNNIEIIAIAMHLASQLATTNNLEKLPVLNYKLDGIKFDLNNPVPYRNIAQVFYKDAFLQTTKNDKINLRDRHFMIAAISVILLALIAPVIITVFAFSLPVSIPVAITLCIAASSILSLIYGVGFVIDSILSDIEITKTHEIKELKLSTTHPRNYGSCFGLFRCKLEKEEGSEIVDRLDFSKIALSS